MTDISIPTASADWPFPQPPVIDVLMTAFNSEKTIRGAVESMLGQTFTRLRMIVVDDGSTDGTGAILRELAAEDARVVVVTQPNGGIVAAANRGLQACTAEFVARMDSDDISFPQRLQRQIDHMRANPDCVAVSGTMFHIREDGSRTETIPRFMPPDQAQPMEVPSREPYLMHPFVLIRRDALVAVGGYRHCSYAEDTDLYWRLQEIGRLDILPEFFGEYRIHTKSVTSGSVVNGRISAIHSQLSGISAVRRRAGKPDLVFAVDTFATLKNIADLSRMIDYVSGPLTEKERRFLRVSVVVKLFSLAHYRPYELEKSDCAFGRKTIIEELPELSLSGRTQALYFWKMSWARLMLARRFDLAGALYDPAIRRSGLLSLVKMTIWRVLPSSIGSKRNRRWTMNQITSIRERHLIISTFDPSP